MKSTTRLDSAVFHLTPTRTRCDLIIIANGKKEKIASGLLTPFLAHLKAAQDQTEKGGYSILLEPDPDDEATWFTKGTVERFVRFVSTPEILERVYTLELEILQIEEAIAIQRSNDTGQSTVEEHEKPTRAREGHKLKPELGEEKAIVLYTPGVYQPQTNCESPPEVNSRVQLLKVLETRKTVIQKEQGMAFARAVAAGYEIDNIPPLVSFAKCFGASRLMDACIRFTDLWNKKHENGQWLEIEAAQSMPISSPVNSSGIVLSSSVSREIDLNGDLASPNNQKPQVELSPGERPHVPVGQQEYFQGQFPNQMYPTWPIHSPPGMMPMYPAYPVQGMPYYQGFPGNMPPFYQPPHPQMDDYRMNVTPNAGVKKQTLDGGDRNHNSGSSTSNSSSPDDDLELDKEASQKSQKRSGRSRKDKSDVVVIRNINYIASQAKDSASESSIDSEADDNEHDSKPSRRNGRSIGKSNNDYEENSVVNQNDYGNWNAFQGFLLSGADEEARTKDLNVMENGANMKRRLKRDGVDDPLANNGRDPSEIHDRRSRDVDESNGKFLNKFRVSNDAIMSSATGSDNARAQNHEINMHFTEANGRNVISRSSNDNFLGENRDQFSYSSDPLAVNGFERAKYRSDAVSSNEIGDESFIVPFRSSSSIQVGPEDRRTAIDMDSELPSAHQKPEDNKIRKELGYEADDLNLIPERGTERRSIGYDPALDYEMQIYAEGSVRKSQNAAEVANDAKKGTSRLDRGRNSKATSESMSKRTTGGPIRKVKPSKMSPLEDARARADKLRAFKADIQKLKKEQEDADLKRLEALKLERQKRIASRNNSSSGNTTATLPQMKKPPPKLSPITNRGSKFSDSEIGSSSPLQRSKVRASVGSIESREASKSMKPNEGSRLSKSVSSLPQLKKESSSIGPESKASSVRVRRLSEPKPVGPHSEQAQKLKSDGPDSKKISAIINLDKSKAASLPELKIRTPPRGSSNPTQKKMTGNDVIKSNQAKPSATSDNSDSYMDNEVDDNQIIDKTVLVLENDKPSIPAVVQGSRNFQSEFTSMHAQPSSNHVLHSESKPDLLQDKSISHEVKTYETDSSRFSDINPTEIMTYNPPFARNTSLEEPSPTSSGTVSTAKVFISAEKAQRADSIPEVSDKIQVKESPKGFRRLLKFGKKKHNSSSTSFDESSEPVTSDNNGKAISYEVHTLKNLILEDETPPPVAGSSSSKSSRHFSLLSPFRSKAAGDKRSGQTT